MTAMLLKMQMSWGETLKTSIVGLLVVITILAVIAVLILLISKIMGAATKAFSKKKPEAEPIKETATASVAAKPAGRELPETQSQGTLQLENVDEPTAAVIMAIVSNQSGIPLNRLAFKSIKLIEEK